MLKDRLREARKNADMTQKEVAARLDMTEAGYCCYETGKRIPNALQIARLAQIFDVTGDYLLETVELENNRNVPILGRIACGAPILAEENIEEYITLPTGVRADYALYCRGDSMTGAGIYDGDVVYIRQTADVQDGQIAAVRICDEATLKRIFRVPDGLLLVADNPTQPRRLYTGPEAAEVEIMGLAVAYLHKIQT